MSEETWLWEYPSGGGEYMPEELMPLALSLLNPDKRQQYEIEISDTSLQKWIDENWQYYGTKAFVRYSTYTCRDYRYCIGNLDIALMRGSKKVMESGYRIKSDFACNLASRYLRRIKFIGLTRRDIVDMELALSHRISQNGWYISPQVTVIPLTMNVGKPWKSWVSGEIIVTIYRNGDFENISPQEYCELLKQRRADTEIVNSAIKAINDLNHQIELERECKLRDAELLAANKERGKKARIAAVAKKNENLIALAMCEELGFMDGIKQKADALAREDVQ